MRRLILTSTLVAALAASSASAAQAATRYASPTSTSTAPPCAQEAPCTLVSAIGGANVDDEIVLLPGDYVLSTAISVSDRLHVRGAAGPRPRIIGKASSSLTTFTMKKGGSLRDVSIEANGAGADALTLTGGIAERVVLSSAGGDGAKVAGFTGGTVLRDSVVRTNANSGSQAALKLRDGANSTPGDVTLVNVTAISSGQADGVLCEQTVGQTTIVNTIIRGGASDLKGKAANVKCAVSNSNIRTLASSYFQSGGANIEDDPKFANAAAGNFRPLAGASGINGGATHALLGSLDLDNHGRALQGIPDIGAYEFDAGDPPTADDPTAFPAPPPAAIVEDTQAQEPTSTTPQPTTTTVTTPAPAPAPVVQAPVELPITVTPPVLGRAVVLAPARGTVTVRLPGSARAVGLDEAETLPVGSVVDATKGAVTLRSALDASGAVQTGTFSGGAFQIRQDRKQRGMVDIVLRGGDFGACRATRRSVPRSRTTAFAAARRRVVRKLWGSDKGGRFRTKGRNSVATVRGTRWLTEDRCDGTFTKVTEGAVEVRDLKRGTKTLVRAGRSKLVRP